MVELNIHTKTPDLHKYALYFTLKIVFCAVGR